MSSDFAKGEKGKGRRRKRAPRETPFAQWLQLFMETHQRDRAWIASHVTVSLQTVYRWLDGTMAPRYPEATQTLLTLKVDEQKQAPEPVRETDARRNDDVAAMLEHLRRALEDAKAWMSEDRWRRRLEHLRHQADLLTDEEHPPPKRRGGSPQAAQGGAAKQGAAGDTIDQDWAF